METTGPPAILVTFLQLLLPVAIAVVAVWRGEHAHRVGAERKIRAWTRRAYVCFIVWGAFIVLAVPILLWIEGLPFSTQQGAAASFGFLAGVPAMIVFLVGSFHALMVWRVTRIRLLLVPTVLLATGFFFSESVSTPLQDGPWDEVVGVAYGLFMLGVSIRGLRGPTLSR